MICGLFDTIGYKSGEEKTTKHHTMTTKVTIICSKKPRVKVYGSTGQEFLEAKQYYIEKFGKMELLKMLKQNSLHTTRPKKFHIVKKLLEQLSRQLESDSDEELTLKNTPQQKKRKKKMEFAWLPTMAKELEFQEKHDQRSDNLCGQIFESRRPREYRKPAHCRIQAQLVFGLQVPRSTL